jgi:hypothetical protein
VEKKASFRALQTLNHCLMKREQPWEKFKLIAAKVVTVRACKSVTQNVGEMMLDSMDFCMIFL